LCVEQVSFLWRLRRETFLLLSLMTLIVLFVVTGLVASSYHAKEKAVGQDWFTRGDNDLRAGHAEAAVEDLRTALVYSRDNPLYELRLAQALAAAGRLNEARTYLVGLWEGEPGSGIVNLELARLAVRTNSLPDALRYFHGAIYGEWAGDMARQRRAARLELADFLLKAGETSHAQSELIALAADLPNDPQLLTRVGKMLLQIGEFNQALTLFRRSVRQSPKYDLALAGEGEACFHLNNFADAQRYLSRAVAENPQLTSTASLLATTRLVLGIDPYDRRLSSAERAARVLRAFRQGMARLEACAAHQGVALGAKGGMSELQRVNEQAAKLEPRLRRSALLRHPDLGNDAMDIVLEVEEVTQRECGEPQGLDKALLIVARAQGGIRP
jgi:predicted Zn-dependent protease